MKLSYKTKPVLWSTSCWVFLNAVLLLNFIAVTLLVQKVVYSHTAVQKVVYSHTAVQKVVQKSKSTGSIEDRSK